MSESDGAKRAIAGWMIACAWLLTAVVCYFGLGSWLGFAVEGMDRSMLSSGPLVLTGIALILSLALTVVWARGLFTDGDGDAPPQGVGRRS